MDEEAEKETSGHWTDHLVPWAMMVVGTMMLTMTMMLKAMLMTIGLEEIY